MTIEDAAYGHAKQNPELKQINLMLAVDFLNSGDVCYTEDEGSITDKSVYRSVLAQMKSYGFDPRRDSSGYRPRLLVGHGVSESF